MGFQGFQGGLCGRHSHGVSPRDSHAIPPTIGGGTQVDDLLRDLVKEQIRNIFGQEMGGGQRDPDPLMENIRIATLTCPAGLKS